MTPTELAVVAAVVLVAGAVNGLAGFGFALVGTAALASVLGPATAVVVMILPVVAVNLALVRELSPAQLRACGRRFGPLVGAALVGAVGGTALLGRVPAAPLKAGLGVVTLGFVVVSQRLVRVPGLAWSRERCFADGRPAMAALGAVSGLLFGATNVGVQLVAYLRSRELSHGLFVGVVAMVFVGLNGVRAAAAWLLGLYPGPAVVGGSALAAAPAVAGVAVGKRLRGRATERVRRGVVLGLQAVVGVRLLAGGLGVA